MAFAPDAAAGVAADAGSGAIVGVAVGNGVAVGIGVALGKGVGIGVAVGMGAGLGAHAAKSRQSGASRMRGGSGGRGIRMQGIVVDGARRGNGGGRVFKGARALRLLIIRAYGDTGMPIFLGKRQPNNSWGWKSRRVWGIGARWKSRRGGAIAGKVFCDIIPKIRGGGGGGKIKRRYNAGGNFAEITGIITLRNLTM